jgi:hypothetical protein
MALADSVSLGPHVLRTVPSTHRNKIFGKDTDNFVFASHIWIQLSIFGKEICDLAQGFNFWMFAKNCWESVEGESPSKEEKN